MNQTHLKHSTSGFAALERGRDLPFSFERRAVREHDVAVRVYILRLNLLFNTVGEQQMK